MKKLLLHICCGPCSTHPATLLASEYEVIGYFYNPNIWPYEEWLKRFEAFKKFCEESKAMADYFPKNAVSRQEYANEHKKFLENTKGLEKEPEGGARCPVCFRFRIEESARFAKEQGIEIIATTLTIGRNKRPEIINLIGKAVAEKYGVKFYEVNFKKQDGALKRSVICKKYNLYRQHYCGCEYSL